MTVGQIAIAFKACGKELANNFEACVALDKSDNNVKRVIFSALGVDFDDFKEATDTLQKMYSLSDVDVLNILDFTKAHNLETCDFIGGYYEDVVDTYIYEMLDDIFENSEIEFEQDYDKKAYMSGKIPFKFEGGPDFIQAIKASDFPPLIKIIKASAPHLDFSDKD